MTGMILHFLYAGMVQLDPLCIIDGGFRLGVVRIKGLALKAAFVPTGC